MTGTAVTKGEALFPRIDIPAELEALAALGAPKETPAETAEAAEADAPLKPEITIDDFAKVDFRVAEVVRCEKHPKADKLLVLQLKVGEEERQVVSGIAQWYTPESLIGRKVILVANLKPVKLRGVESNGMILAASKGDRLELVSADIPSGAIVS